jgi:hypothetical protein
MTHHRRQSAGPPPLTPPHRKSGLPDLRTVMRNPGRPGFRGEGNTPSKRTAVYQLHRNVR